MRLLAPSVVTALVAVSSLAPAQATKVDYPSSALQSPPSFLFPFYTTPGGAVRYQTMCPATFPGLPAQPMIATGIGLQIAGQERYDRFEIRLGTTDRTTLAFEWLSNLPDQRLQVDLSGTVLPGGLQAGNPVNRWVEFDLDKPFVWTPGESVTLDIVAQASSATSWCMTAAGSHERMYAAPYAGGTTGQVDPDMGIVFRIVFEPLGFPTYGSACSGTRGFAPTASATGSSQLGSAFHIDLSSGLGAAPTVLLMGTSRARNAFGRLPFAFGGGCELLNSMELTFAFLASGSGAGAGTASLAARVPNNPAVIGTVLYAQWMQFDAGSSSAIPLTASNGVIAVVQ